MTRAAEVPERYDTNFVRELIAEHGAEDVIIGLVWRGRPTVGLRSRPAIVGSDGHPSTQCLWADTGQDPRDTGERPCLRCGLVADDGDAPDPCLGWIDGVAAACCGHGNAWGDPYVWFAGSDDIRGQAALDWFTEHGIGPDVSRPDASPSREPLGPD